MTIAENNHAGTDRVASGGGRPRLVVASTFPVQPALGGGQVRALQLYGRLGVAFDVELVTLVGVGERGGRTQLGPGVWERRVPKTSEHQERESALQRAAGTVVTDVAMAELYRYTPEYCAQLRDAAAGARAMVACHPYAYPAMRAASELPVWYDAHNVEAVLKAQVLRGTPEAERLLAAAEAVERACYTDSEQVWACSERDREELLERYGGAPERVLVVPNGAADDEVPYVAPALRAERKRALRLGGRFLALFIASWHDPNVVGARELMQLGAQLPEIELMIVGSVGNALAGSPLPGNVHLTGPVSAEFKLAVLGIADVALNPVRTGSGTNLKMLDYFCSGIPVVSTEFGARGLGVQSGVHFLHAETGAFPAMLRRLRGLDPIALEPIVVAARRHVEQAFSWSAVAAALLSALRAHDQRASRPRA